MTETGIALRILDRITKAKGLEELQAIRDEVARLELSAFSRGRVEEALVARTEVLMDAIAKRADEVFPVGKPVDRPSSSPPAAATSAIPSVYQAEDLAGSTETQELVVPIATPEQARAAWARYVAIAQALEEPQDVVEIEGKRFRRKSFWRKIALAYGIDVQLREASQELKDDAAGAFWSSHVVVRAIARSGRYADGVASCSNREPHREKATAHVVYATAYTRAANRAISDLVAAGEVSAEEVE